MSRGIKLVLMGVAGAALLYSCAPAIGAGWRRLPYLWFLPCSVSTARGALRSPPRSNAGPARRRSSQRPARPHSATTQSQRGGFGSTGSTGGSSGSS